MNGSENNNSSTIPLSQTKEFKLLLNLLEKAEQILSIINLPESSISKYNTLKKMTFDMLNIEFKPLEKNSLSTSNIDNNTKNDKISNNLNDDILYILHFLNIKKTKLIDLILNYIINNNNIEQEKDLNYFLTSLTEIYNLPADVISSKTPNDIFYEAKSEESKLSALFTKIDQVFMNNFEKIKQIKINYENEISNLKDNYNRDLSEFKICLEKNSFLESAKEKNNYHLNKISLLINESYGIFKNYFPNENFDSNIGYNCSGPFDGDIIKLEFIKKIANKFGNKNNYLNNGNFNFDKENKKYENNYNLPYPDNYSNFNNNNNNYGFKEIYSLLPEIQKESDIFHKNFCDLMNYIETNIEGKNI